MSNDRLIEILDQAFNLVRNSKGAHYTDTNLILTSPVYGALVGYLIAEEERKARPQQLNG